MKIALPESAETRTLEAVSIILSRKTAIPVLVGEEKKIKESAASLGISISGSEIFEPAKEPFFGSAVKAFLERTRSKGMSEVEARETVAMPLYSACMLVALGLADGVVSGATHTTAESVRAYLRCFGSKEGIQTVSSFFLIILKDSSFGDDGVLLYSDCGVVPNPSSVQLAEIAISSHRSYKQLAEREPRVALLSFSTKGSSKDPSVEKVAAALGILKSRAPEIVADGEMQFDAAVVPEIGASKAPGSKVAGRANVLIFPDLNSGNIGYKITERLAGATALGPVLQGVAKAANDLSRGCRASDIADVVAITAVQAQEYLFERGI